MYALGIDLGTTFTAAAIWRDGRAETVSLGDRSAAIPSVVLLRQDETFLTGDAAHRRGFSEPQRVAREFKRRLGDTTPILLGGVPQSAEALMSRLLRWVVDEVSRREGSRPDVVCVTHPANWGPYKMDLLRQAARMADLDVPVTYASEPEAAAVNYTQQQRVEQGTVVAVYDLGGGTFDAAVLRKTATGFEVLGQPEGIERLGGTDFDAAVFNHVRTALGGKLEELDEDDPAVINAVVRLRDECVQAKEALSSDTDTTIPVLLPNVSTEVRLTRAEFEAMVRPALHGSVEALQRAIRSADCDPDEVHSVLLVGGSSRMPIVAQLVGSEVGRPVVVDAHPKHAVALGAAWLAGGELAKPATPAAAATPAPARQPAAAAAPAAPAAPATPAAPAAAATPPRQQAAPAAAQARPPASPAAPPVPVVSPAASGGPVPATYRGGSMTPDPSTRVLQPALPAATVVGNAGVPAPGGDPTGRTTTFVSASAAGATSTSSRGRGRVALLAAGAVLVVLLGGGAAAWAYTNRNAGDGDRKAADGGRTTAATAPAVPADEQCTDEIKSNPRWVCLTSAKVSGGKFTLEYDGDFDGTPLAVKGGYHLHIWGSDGITPPDAIMGEQAGDQKGFWYVDDRKTSVLDTDDQRYTKAIGDAPKVCARIANSHHGLVEDDQGNYRTGNCVPIKRG
ncbi:Hsp70 protein [Krasilnikovia cinnamomea]|uniref:Hsp70 protein n=1 Tax=Krasilnikovia cinnamomea TaxID=349313 RepID=A0A4Q7ZS38_9ACTN|nr:Hsp70 family protein [Krasilnikovia cinnamomea]RZU53987.1 Hsp70 protein [Krasilnikovia cinnamomea]